MTPQLDEARPLDEEVERLLNVHQVADRLGVSSATVWRMLKDDELPQPLVLGKLTRWRVHDFNTWVRKLPAARADTRTRRKG
jgi:excisionase family DNA binding protein